MRSIAGIRHGSVASRHIDDASLEEYALGRAPETAFQRIDDHVRRCPACGERAASLAERADFLAEALSRLKPLFRHHTADGEITAHVRRSRSGYYAARLIGRMLDCGKRCVTEGEAQRWCETAFGEMFPEHRCGRRCDPGIPRYAADGLTTT